MVVFSPSAGQRNGGSRKGIAQLPPSLPPCGRAARDLPLEYVATLSDALTRAVVFRQHLRIDLLHTEHIQESSNTARVYADGGEDPSANSRGPRQLYLRAPSFLPRIPKRRRGWG